MQQLDFPDTVGHWAFSGKYRVNGKLVPLQKLYHVLERTEILDATMARYPAIRIAGDSVVWYGKYIALYSGEEVLYWDGKWTRIYMPWESAPAAQPSRIICAACNDHLDPLEPSYCNICYDVMESAAQPQPTRGQPHVNVPWHPVDAILWDGKSLYADDLAVTIGEGDTALATFVWPSEGDYAVCKRMQRPDYNMGATYTRDGDVVTVDMQPPD